MAQKVSKLLKIHLYSVLTSVTYINEAKVRKEGSDTLRERPRMDKGKCSFSRQHTWGGSVAAVALIVNVGLSLPFAVPLSPVCKQRFSHSSHSRYV